MPNDTVSYADIILPDTTYPERDDPMFGVGFSPDAAVATSVEAIADGITRVLDDAALAGELSRRGIERARNFSWSRTAREHLDLYRELAQ